MGISYVSCGLYTGHSLVLVPCWHNVNVYRFKFEKSLQFNLWRFENDITQTKKHFKLFANELRCIGLRLSEHLLFAREFKTDYTRPRRLRRNKLTLGLEL